MKINPYVRRMKKMEYTGLVGMKEERKSEKMIWTLGIVFCIVVLVIGCSKKIIQERKI